MLKQFETLPQDMQRNKTDVLGLQETKLYTLGRYEIGDYTLLTLTAASKMYGISAQFNRRHITFTTSDFNAKLGNRVTGETFLGVHARGRRNRNGRALAAFWDAFQFFAANTAFKKRARNKTTWTQRRKEHIVYNQIDYVLCPQNCRRFCQDAQSWGGTLTASDHKL
ncbi:hypothetical protein L917_13036, partial [Phytophthora nicotianae]